MATKELQELEMEAEKLKEDIVWRSWQVKFNQEEISKSRKGLKVPTIAREHRGSLRRKIQRCEGYVTYHKKLIKEIEVKLQERATDMDRCEAKGTVALNNSASRSQYSKAMEQQISIQYMRSRSALLGLAGSGKSHTLALMLREEPSCKRISTPCVLSPLRTFRLRLDKPRMIKLSDMVYVEMALKTAKEGIANSSIASAELDGEAAIPSDAVEKTMLVSFHYADENVESLNGQLIGEMIDCGGQLQFLEILPRFIDNLSLGILVTNLSQRFDHHPLIHYFSDDGEPIGKGIPSKFSNEQTLRLCLRTIVSQSRGGQKVKFIFVGTHKDLEHECDESRQEKNGKLKEMLKSFGLEDNAIYTSEGDLIFAINALNPSDIDRQVASQLCEQMMDTSASEMVCIPVNYCALELTLKKMVRETTKWVFSKSEILSQVSHHHFTEESLEKGLKYLHRAKLIFYFNTLFPNMVIGEPQAVFNLLTELVVYHMKLNTNPQSLGPVSGMKKKFGLRGILSLECLNEFPEYYMEGVFCAADMMNLLVELLIVSKVKDGEYLMPCVLSADETIDCNPEPETQSLPAIALYFPEGTARLGLYCGVVCYLMSREKWEICLDGDGKPVHTTRNSMHFSLPGYLGKVTLNDPFDTFYLATLHVPNEVPSHSSMMADMCKVVCLCLLSALTQVSDKLNYQRDPLEVAFLCEQHLCSGAIHPAVMSRDGQLLLCTKDHTMAGRMTEQHWLWLQGDISSDFLPSYFLQPSPSLSTTPTMSCLALLKWKDMEGSTQRLRIVDEICPRWKDVGDIIGLGRSQMDAIEKKRLMDCRDCCRDVLSEWLEHGKKRYPVSWEGMCELLEDLRFNFIAQQLKEALTEGSGFR